MFYSQFSAKFEYQWFESIKNMEPSDEVRPAESVSLWDYFFEQQSKKENNKWIRIG